MSRRSSRPGSVADERVVVLVTVTDVVTVSVVLTVENSVEVLEIVEATGGLLAEPPRYARLAVAMRRTAKAATREDLIEAAVCEFLLFPLRRTRLFQRCKAYIHHVVVYPL